MKLIESGVECPTCGERMTCVVWDSGAEYVCPNMDYRSVCQGRSASREEDANA